MAHMLKFTYSKSLRIGLRIGAALFLLAAPFYFAELFYPSLTGPSGISFLVFGYFALSEGIILARARRLLSSLKPKKLCLYLARYEFAMNPLLTIAVLSLSAIFPLVEHDWLYYVNIGITFGLIVYRSWLTIYLSKKMKEGDDGFLPLRNHSYIGLSFLWIILNYYIFASVKTIGVDMALLSQGKIAGLSEWYVVTTVLEALIGLVVLLQSLFMSLSSHFSGITDEPIDLRINFEKSKELIETYHIPFYISIFATFILFVISLVSTIQNPAPYVALTVLYFIVLAVRIPTFYAMQRIDKKEKDPSKSFVKKHGPLVYAAAFILAYAAVCIVFGSLNFQKAGEVERTTFMAFGVFVPWAIVKMILGTRSFIKARKSADPVEFMNAVIDILLAMFTLGQTIAIFATQAHLDAIRIIAMIFSILIGTYCVIIAIQMFVVGIRGSRGKRVKALALFLRCKEQGKKEE